MDNQSAQIATICECIDHCFAFSTWCDSFAQHVDPDDMVLGLARGVELVSDATRLQSFLALRKLDDFLGAVQPKQDDIAAAKLGIDVKAVLEGIGDTLLTTAERADVNKSVAHLTEKLHLDPESEVDLQGILARSTPVFSRLIDAFRATDAAREATQSIDLTASLIAYHTGGIG